MDTFYLISILLLGLALIYLVIKNQIVKMMEDRLHTLYREKIETDIQDIYREFESYSAIIDSRITRLKTLTERQESSVKAWENIQNEIKKAKAGKDLLNYLDTKQNSPALEIESLEQVKKEITAELKAYLAQKLNLGASPLQTPKIKTQPPVSSDLKKKTQGIEKPVSSELENIDFNVAEMVIDEMVSAPQRPQAVKLNRSPVSVNTLKPQTPDNENTEESQKGFFNIMATVGRALSPIFMKSTNEPISPKDDIFRDASPRGNFNDLIKREMQTPRVPRENKEVLNTTETINKNPENTLPEAVMEEEKIHVNTPLQPAELIRLIEDLKNSKLRPEALKNLVAQGFDLNQIAELSSIPYSDLELTRNLYQI